jgi:hypothetical protein
MTEYVFAPIRGFLVHLAQGWRFPGLVAEPAMGHHGAYSVLLVRPVGGGG